MVIFILPIVLVASKITAGRLAARAVGSSAGEAGESIRKFVLKRFCYVVASTHAPADWRPRGRRRRGSAKVPQTRTPPEPTTLTTISTLILRLATENPTWSNQEVADEVRRRHPEARTTRASVSSVKSRAKSAAVGAPAEYETKRKPAVARYKSMAIGNAQNWIVRNLLGRLGDHGFTKADWERVRDGTFGGRCAYCGQPGRLEMEHAIPISIEKLGEHHLGNLVPACRDCNSRKGDADYAEFLVDNPDRKRVIDAHMARHDYRPLCDDSSVREAAHEETRAMTDRYARLLNELARNNGLSSPESDSRP